MATLPSFPTDIRRLSTFPYIEGQQWEFKESGTDICLKKLTATVCAFLNSAGGYMVFGIRDDGCVLGISRKAIDKIMLSVDNIIHTGTIKNTTTGGHVTPAELKAYSVELAGWKGDNRLLVVEVASMNTGHIYKMNNGVAMYRLSASNLTSTTFILGDEHALKDMHDINEKLRAENMALSADNVRLRQSIITLTSENDSIKSKAYNATVSNVELLRAVKASTAAHMDAESKLQFLTTTLESTKSELSECTASLKATESKLTEVVSLLHARILADKEMTEARMKRSSGWLCGLFCS